LDRYRKNLENMKAAQENVGIEAFPMMDPYFRAQEERMAKLE